MKYNLGGFLNEKSCSCFGVFFKESVFIAFFFLYDCVFGVAEMRISTLAFMRSSTFFDLSAVLDQSIEILKDNIDRAKWVKITLDDAAVDTPHNGDGGIGLQVTRVFACEGYLSYNGCGNLNGERCTVWDRLALLVASCNG